MCLHDCLSLFDFRLSAYLSLLFHLAPAFIIPLLPNFFLLCFHPSFLYHPFHSLPVYLLRCIPCCLPLSFPVRLSDCFLSCLFTSLPSAFFLFTSLPFPFHPVSLFCLLPSSVRLVTCRLSVSMAIRLSAYLPVHLLVRLAIRLPIVCLSLCLSVCLSVGLLVRLSVRLPVCMSVCLSVCMSVCPSVCLSACLRGYVDPSTSNPAFGSGGGA